MSEVKDTFTVVSFYKFLNLNETSYKELISTLKSKIKEFEIKGLIISAYEGLNGTVAGSEDNIKSFVDYLLTISNDDWKFKYSKSSFMPFKRFSLKFRPEIVTTGKEYLKPDMKDDSHISAEEWHNILTSNEDYALIDVRNDYEVEIGKFKGAIDPKTKDFKEFPEFVEKSGIPKDKQILMYCTGGIRCEKAYLEMKELGYNNIKQLDGGILTYMEKYPNGQFEGECFVFDDRVALDAELKPSKNFSLCPHCGNTAIEFIECKNCGCEKKVCSKCTESDESKKTCSKNCRYHYSIKLSGNRVTKPKKSQVITMAALLIISLISMMPLNLYAAESSPEAVIKQVVTLIKKQGNPSPVVDFVNWDDSLAKLSDKNKEMMNVKTSSDLREFYRKILKSPSSELERLFENKFKERLGEEKTRAMLDTMKKRTEVKEEEIKKRIQESDYVVGAAQINGDTATVPLTYNYNSERKTDNVKLIKKDGKWMFAALGQGFSFNTEHTK